MGSNACSGQGARGSVLFNENEVEHAGHQQQHRCLPVGTPPGHSARAFAPPPRGMRTCRTKLGFLYDFFLIYIWHLQYEYESTVG